MKNINIRPVLNGFVVEVGCQQVVFTDVATMCREIMRYQKDPEGVEKEYIGGALNKQAMERTEEAREARPETQLDDPWGKAMTASGLSIRPPRLR